MHTQSYHNASTSSIGKRSQQSLSKNNNRKNYQQKMHSYDKSNTSLVSNNTQSVFDRLYQDSKNKQTTKKMVTLNTENTRQVLRDRTSSMNNSQNCSIIYDKNVKLKE